MKQLKLIILLILTIVFTTCKKKTTITVKVFNPALNEYVSGAVVSLLEIKETKGFIGIGSKTECNEIATATTDANGIASFDKEKLRTGNKFKYKLAIKESWGIAHRDPCGSQTQDYLDVGKTQEIQLSDYLDTQVKIQYNNVFNSGTNGDSLICLIDQVSYYDPMIGHNQGGGGIGGLIIDYNSFFPFPSQSITQPITIFANRLTVKTRKRKMGIITTAIDTVRAYPNQTTTIQINW